MERARVQVGRFLIIVLVSSGAVLHGKTRRRGGGCHMANATTYNDDGDDDDGDHRHEYHESLANTRDPDKAARRE